MSDLSDYLYLLSKARIPTCKFCRAQATRSVFDFLVCKEHDQRQETTGEGFLALVEELIFCFSCKTCGAYFRFDDGVVSIYDQPMPCHDCQPVHAMAIQVAKLKRQMSLASPG